MTRISPSLLAAACAFLTACSGAPSDSEIKHAVTKQYNEQLEATAKITGSFAGNAMVKEIAESFRMNIKDVRKIGCKDDGEKAYNCDFEIEVEKAGKTQKTTSKARFIKGSDGWVVSG